MKYGVERIDEFADGYMEQLLNNELPVELLFNDAEAYHKRKLDRDSEAIERIDVNSLLYRANS